MKQTDRRKGACIRRCAACGRREDKRQYAFLRVARSSDGTVRLDPMSTAPGRGAYVCRKAECVRILCKQRRLHRLLRGPVPVDLYESLLNEVCADE